MLLMVLGPVVLQPFAITWSHKIQDPTIETWPMTFKAKGCHKAPWKHLSAPRIFVTLSESKGTP